MICQRCAKEKPDVHTCSPSDLVRKLESQRDELLAALEMARTGIAWHIENAPPSAMLKLPLERTAFHVKHGFSWVSCAPFVENSRGVLIHRPRSGATYNIHRHPHVGVTFWCGMSVSSDGKNLTFLAAPPNDRILCARCEAIAVANGLPSVDELAGRHVHKGGVVAVATCCDGVKP